MWQQKGKFKRLIRETKYTTCDTTQHNAWVNKEAWNIQTIVCGRVMHRRLSKITRLIEAEHGVELDQAHRAVIVEQQPRKQPPPFMCYFCGNPIQLVVISQTCLLCVAHAQCVVRPTLLGLVVTKEFPVTVLFPLALDDESGASAHSPFQRLIASAVVMATRVCVF